MEKGKKVKRDGNIFRQEFESSKSGFSQKGFHRQYLLGGLVPALCWTVKVQSQGGGHISILRILLTRVGIKAREERAAKRRRYEVENLYRKSFTRPS